VAGPELLVTDSTTPGRSNRTDSPIGGFGGTFSIFIYIPFLRHDCVGYVIGEALAVVGKIGGVMALVWQIWEWSHRRMG
jgi:hypothetical protein